MKHVWGKVCAASVAAAGVGVFTPAANAESRPLEFETEFDLGVAPAANAIQAELAATTVSAWEQSIGSYLDRFVEAAKEAVAQPAPAAQDTAVQAAVDAELSAFAAAIEKPLPPQHFLSRFGTAGDDRNRNIGPWRLPANRFNQKIDTVSAECFIREQDGSAGLVQL